MSSIHHKTEYEEVVIEQGENNKQQSSNAMVQSKFIYIAFAIVFAVILVQGIVLYCLLKPSLSTKQQSLFLDKIVNSACKLPKSSKENIPTSFSNSVNLIDFSVETSHLINKIESTLINYDNGTVGRAIRFKPTNECLTGGFIAHYSSGKYSYYKVFPAKCDGSQVQQWRMLENRLHVGTAANYPLFSYPTFSPCLECYGRGRSCDLIVHPCNNFVENVFHIRIFANQIDFSQNRVYFTIHNSYYSTLCLGRQYNEQYKVNVFYLQECTGNDDQSFYLQDLDLAEEIENIRNEISSPLWSVLLGSEGKQQCPNNS